MKRKIFLMAVILLIASSLMGADKDIHVKIDASVDKKTLFIGEKIRYVIKVISKENLDVKFPKFEDGEMGDFEIKESNSMTKKDLFGEKTILRWYDITTYSPGSHAIPSSKLEYRQKGKKDWVSGAANPITVAVASVLALEKNAQDIKDIKGPLYFREVNWFLILSIFVIFAVCALIFIIYKINSRKSPVRLPHETALEELEQIRGLLSKTQDVKEFYVRISDCIRRYIERAFALKAPEMTTEEFLFSLGGSRRLSLDQKGLLKDFLSACDLVKFAKYMPPGPEIDSVFVSAKNFVLETRLVVTGNVEDK